ncbi:MAG: DUF3471 domain-containing protein [Acidobacteriota bacterium]|nr:DUF3471 domain-containing protein [Acidobacteriota bacterium]
MKNSLRALFIALSLLISFQSYQDTNAQTTPEKKPATNLQDYVGRFEADPVALENFVFDVFLDKDELWIKPSHSPKRKLAEKSADTFVMTEMEAPIKFTRDAKGMVTGLTLEAPSMSQGTRTLDARKLVLPAASLKGSTTFRLKGYPNARVVAVGGTFNDFNQSQLLCGKEGEGWVCRIDLAPGKYTYKFIIDGDWILDPDNPNSEDDERGFTNSVLVVKSNP